jgi:hypothetical protein
MRWPNGQCPEADLAAEREGSLLKILERWASQADSTVELLELLLGAGFASASIEPDTAGLADLVAVGPGGEPSVRVKTFRANPSFDQLRHAITTGRASQELDAGTTGVTPDFEEALATLIAGALEGRDTVGLTRTREDLLAVLAEAARMVSDVPASPGTQQETSC